MRERNMPEKTAKAVTGMLNKVLKVDANSAACIVMHQPKAPKELKRFRNEE